MATSLFYTEFDGMLMNDMSPNMREQYLAFLLDIDKTVARRMLEKTKKKSWLEKLKDRLFKTKRLKERVNDLNLKSLENKYDKKGNIIQRGSTK